MKQGWRFLLIIGFYFFKMESASAILYVEPEVGAVSYSISTKDTAAGISSGTSGATSGFAGGMKLGVRQDYVHIVGNLNYVNLAGNSNDRIYGASGFEYGAGLGWEWSIPILTTVGFSSLNLAANGTTTTTSGFKLDLGYFFSTKTKLNVTYMNLSAAEESRNISSTVVFAMLSFPIEFEYPSGHWRGK